MKTPTRREALVTIAGTVAATAVTGSTPAAASPQTYQPQALSQKQFDLVSTLVEMIIPTSDTPGAAAAGVDRYIDQELEADREGAGKFQAGLKLLTDAGFAGKSEAERTALLTEFSEASGEKGEFFRLLKDMTIDGYYTTEIGLVEELGYQGNTFLPEFPGCQHEEKL